jgi:hypothetical protein
MFPGAHHAAKPIPIGRDGLPAFTRPCAAVDPILVPLSRGSRISDKGVGARLPRKEDDRFLRGRGEYVANILVPGMLDVAFVRSPMAHGMPGQQVL